MKVYKIYYIVATMLFFACANSHAMGVLRALTHAADNAAGQSPVLSPHPRVVTAARIGRPQDQECGAHAAAELNTFDTVFESAGIISQQEEIRMRYGPQFFSVCTQLERALASNDAARIRAILSHTFESLDAGGSRLTFFQLAVLMGSSGDVAVCLEYLQDLNPNVQLCDFGLTPLEIAIQAEDEPTVAALIHARDAAGRNRVNVNQVGAFGTPIHMAATLENGSAMLRILVATGADIAAIHNGETPLQLAQRRFGHMHSNVLGIEEMLTRQDSDSLMSSMIKSFVLGYLIYIKSKIS